MNIAFRPIPDLSTRHADLFWSKVDKTDPSGCWLWTASRNAKGYGSFGVWADDRSSTFMAHRVALHITGRKLDAQRVVDHICRNRACVNPAHLRLVESRENTLATGSVALAAIWHERSACSAGHEYTPENTRLRREGSRICRACEQTRARARQRTAAVNAPA